ncbi:MAG: AmmeMemoRadiSam system protein B [candidate division Zixibacteria bacterium]|nr:AmmeMemoRadiSam system protein B [candidate division Zixibacteria bacterium]
MSKRPDNIRKPAVAGSWYPGKVSDLVKQIAGFYAEVDKVALSGRPQALICPHAGYQYSGKVAASAFKLLEGEEYDTVVIVAPYHRPEFFQGCSVYDGDGYQTPIGVIETDHELAERIAGINPLVYRSRQGHGTGASRAEHALEIQLPFLQVVLGDFRLVPIIMGDQDEASVHALGEVLGSVLRERNCLMVASTDLSHFHNDKQARELDGRVQKAIEAFDPDGLLDLLSSGEGEACGGGPTAAVMLAAKRLGSTEVRTVDYATSGNTTGDFSEVVGYLSAAIVMGTKAQTKLEDHQNSQIGMTAARKRDETLPDDLKPILRRIARKAISARLKGFEHTPEYSESLDIRRGAFVTLKIDGKLRGCIGQTHAREPLYQLIAEMAVAAAFDDPRFPALTEEEWDRLEYEISVLTPLQRVKDFKQIKIGRDGLIVKLDVHTGLLLPQVATEYGWNTTQFLEQTCLKAGLPKESYKDKYAEVYRFSAEVF